MLTPGSIIIHSSLSDSTNQESSKPTNVNIGAVLDLISTLKIKSLAYLFLSLSGNVNVTGLFSSVISIVVIE
jgi:hypothetical protein